MKDANKLAWIAAFVLALIATAILLLGWYSNNFESFAPLYLKYGGAVVRGDRLPTDEQTVYEVKSAGFDKSPINFTVSVQANADFSYVADGRYYRFARTGDLTGAFAIEKSENGFSFGTASFDLQTILARHHGADEITLGELPKNVDFYLVSVQGNGKSLSFFLNVKNYVIVPGSSIIIEPDRVIF